jgi:hypothetical protein
MLEEGKHQTSARSVQNQQFLKILIPVLLSCWVVIITTCLALCLKHQITVYWMLVSIVWGMLLLFSAWSPRYVNPYLPMLLAWSFWFSIQTDIQLYWKLEMSINKDLFLLQGKMSTHLVHVGILMVIACLLLWIRRRASVFILAFVSITVTATIPKPAEIQIYTMILQASLFCLLYFFSLAVSGVASLSTQDHRHFLLNNIAGSAWVLWVDELLPLIILSAVYVLLCFVTLIARYDKVMLLWQNHDPEPKRGPWEEDPEDEKRD